MATNYHREIQQLYVAYFNRPADARGLAYWGSVVQANNGDTSAVSAAFADSVEYRAAFAGMVPTEVVTQVYKNLFGTVPDLGGLAYWAGHLASGALSINHIVKNIADGALGADQTTYANKVSAALAFTDLLKSSEQIATYENAAVAAAAKQFISSISTDKSLQDALALMPATVASVLEAGVAGKTFSLSLSRDALVGTAGDDVFNGAILTNSNTLQSNDQIDGGAGIDRLEADVRRTDAGELAPHTTGIEQVALRARAPEASAEGEATGVEFDASNMVGVTRWESSGSAVDLAVKHARILPSQSTSDVTIGMFDSAAGSADFAVYFEEGALRPKTSPTNVVRLQLMDTRSAAEGKAPLLQNPYNGFGIYINGVLTQVQDAAIDAATTYDELVFAIRATLANMGIKNITVAKGATFNLTAPSGQSVTGTEITLTSTVGDTFNVTDPGTGWLTNGIVPPASALHASMQIGGNTAAVPVTSNIIVDDVGRGAMGGALVVGGVAANGDVSTLGVQRFQIEVRDSSHLEALGSTGNALREIVLTNGATSGHGSAVPNQGKLTIGATGATGASGAASSVGLTDVRLVDASAMAGSIDVNAAFTTASINKYLGQGSGSSDATAQSVQVKYLGGAGDDRIALTIDGSVASSQRPNDLARENFSFTVEGGAGDDTITVKLVDDALSGNTPAWYTNQAINGNIRIDGGAGDDTIHMPGSGNATIDGGAGNDAIYADNSGVQEGAAGVNQGRATFVFNALDGDAATAGNQFLHGALKTQSAASVSAVNAELTVTYKGISKTVTIANSLHATANVTITDLHVNYAIKEAINFDPVLSRLLVAEDGPDRTLVVRALIDGAHKLSDLAVTFSSTALSATQLGQAAVPTLFSGSVAGFAELTDGFATNFVQYNSAGEAVTGADSVAVSDNIIIGGAGNDVIVLGTSAGADAVASSNDIVKFAPGFGSDTIVNFAASGAGADKLDLTALGGSATGGVSDTVTATNGSITIVAQSAGNDAIDEIVALYAGIDSATAATHVYITYDANNVAKVYAIVDGAGTAAGNITATLVGTIDLADTAWSTLTGGNFV